MGTPQIPARYLWTTLAVSLCLLFDLEAVGFSFLVLFALAKTYLWACDLLDRWDAEDESDAG